MDQRKTMIQILKQLESLFTGITMPTDNNKRQFLASIFDQVYSVINEAQKGACFELVEDELIPVYAKGYDMATLQNLKLRKSDTELGYFELFKQDEISAYSKFIDNSAMDQFTTEQIEMLKYLGTYDGFYSLYAPIKVGNDHVGMIFLDNFSTGFHEESVVILEFYAKMISQYYTLIHAQQREIRFFHEVVGSLVSAIEVKDAYTKGHAQRVMEYSVLLATAFHLPKEIKSDIATAAILHDVGKIGIKDEILNKSDRLTDEEYAIIKQHPTLSKQIVENISGFSRITDLIANHHERYDGQGYPQGLLITDIPCSIISVADAFDAMTSSRAYRQALSREEALKILEQESGKQFHPDVIKKALAIF